MNKESESNNFQESLAGCMMNLKSTQSCLSDQKSTFASLVEFSVHLVSRFLMCKAILIFQKQLFHSKQFVPRPSKILSQPWIPPESQNMNSEQRKLQRIDEHLLVSILSHDST